MVFVAPLHDPPLSGQVLVSNVLLEELLRREVPLAVTNTVRGPDRSWRSVLLRFRRLSWALAALPVFRLRGAGVVYISVFANLGIYHTAACALLARLLRYRLFLHHHSSAHAASRVTPMLVLSHCAGKRAVHIALCDKMSRQLRENYSNVNRTLVLSNPFVIEPQQSGVKPDQGSFTLGHLSNLTVAKGLERVLALFGVFCLECPRARLILAGPVRSPLEARILQKAAAALGEKLRHVGPVSGEAKAAFFNEVDVFLFPSLYPNEAAPLVCLEAMRAGVPFIAYDWGYVRNATGNAGAYVAPAEDFAKQALPVLRRWASNPDDLAAASCRVRAAFHELSEQSCKELEGLISLMLCGRSVRGAN